MSINIKSKGIENINVNYDVLENLRTAVLIFDENLNYIYTNTAAIDLLGSTSTLKDITKLQCENVSLITYLKKVKDDLQSVMLRDLKFKNFDRIERIVDCNISSYSSQKDKFILMELNETCLLYTSPSPRD